MKPNPRCITWWRDPQTLSGYWTVENPDGPYDGRTSPFYVRHYVLNALVSSRGFDTEVRARQEFERKVMAEVEAVS